MYLGENNLTGSLDFLCSAADALHMVADCWGDDSEVDCECCASCCSNDETSVAECEWYSGLESAEKGKIACFMIFTLADAMCGAEITKK